MPQQPNNSATQQLPSSLAATAAICTYNGAERIGYVLETLTKQTIPADQWEVIVVDNRSSDNTVQVCEQWREKLPAPLRLVREETPGLSYARGCAAREARGEIVCFLDDDSPAEPDWVAQAAMAFCERPNAGCLGGKVKPMWESEPTPLVLEVCDFALAICDYGDEPIKYANASGGGPVGAGICVRRSVLLEAYEDDRWAAGNLGPVGKKRISGSEMALNAVIAGLGYEMWYVPQLAIHHMIPANRMRFESLARLHESIGRGQAMTRRLYDWRARNPVLGALIGVKDLGRWLRGRLTGPNAGSHDSPPELRRQLRELQQRQLWGRAWQAMPWH